MARASQQTDGELANATFINTLITDYVSQTDTGDQNVASNLVFAANKGPDSVGTKKVDETNIGDGKALVYKTASGKLEYELAGGGAPAAHASTHETGGSDTVNHDSLVDFVAAEHVSLPNTIATVLSDHNKAAHDALNINADQVDGVDLPGTIANVLSNHTQAVHDALNINADQTDGVDLPGPISSVLSDHNQAAHDALGLSHDSLTNVSAEDHHSDWRHASDTTKIDQADVYGHSMAADYVVWESGGTYYAKSATGVVTSNSDFDALMNNTVIAGISTHGVVQFLGAPASAPNINQTIAVTNKHIRFYLNNWTITTNSGIVMWRFDNCQVEADTGWGQAGLFGGCLNMNNNATVGVELRDCWRVHIDGVHILNVGGADYGVHVYVDDYPDVGCYYNYINVEVEGYTGKPTGSIGIYFDRAGAPTSHTPNLNEVTGRFTGMDYGVRVKYGDQQLFHHCDCVGNNYGYYFESTSHNHSMVHCLCENNSTYGTYIQKDSEVLIWNLVNSGNGTDFYTEADASTTSRYVRVHDDGIYLTSVYNASTEWRTPKIQFGQDGNWALSLKGTGTSLMVYDETGTQDIMAFNKDGKIIFLTATSNKRTIEFHSGDFFRYDDSANRFEWLIGSALELEVDATTIDFNGNKLKDPSNTTGTASGTPVIITVDIGGTDYYVRAYPTLA